MFDNANAAEANASLKRLLSDIRSLGGVFSVDNLRVIGHMPCQ